MKFAKRYDVYADKIHLGYAEYVGHGDFFAFHKDGTPIKAGNYFDSIMEAAEYLTYEFANIDETFEIKLVPANQETTLDGGN